MSRNHDVLRDLALGAAAGLAGTVVLQALRKADHAAAPSADPPMVTEVGPHMVELAESRLERPARARIPGWAEGAAASGLSLGYGATLGALYAALRPRGGPVVADGIALGVATWAVGYLGWLPAIRLMPPLWEQTPAQVAVPVLEHVAYGVVSVAAYQGLRGRAS